VREAILETQDMLNAAPTVQQKTISKALQRHTSEALLIFWINTPADFRNTTCEAAPIIGAEILTVRSVFSPLKNKEQRFETYGRLL